MGEKRNSTRSSADHGGKSSLDKIRSLERRIARLQAMQLKEIARYESTQRSPTEAAAELALTLAINEKSAGRRISMARALIHRLPKTLQAMQRGDLDSHKASKIAGPTASLSHEHVRQVDEIMAGRLDGKTPTQLRRSAAYVVNKVDPDGSAQRAARRRAERRVELAHREDSMASITAYLPAEVAGAAYARIDRLARKSRGADEPRTLDQLRADVFADTVLGKAGNRSAQGPKAEVFVYVDLRTLLEMNDNPAYLAGHGTIPAWIARQLAHDPASTWRRIITDSRTGAPVDVGRKRYRPPRVTDDFVRVRDRECRFPGCHRPSQFGDVDHATAWFRRGHTNARNLIGYCRRHHRLKTAPGWTYQLNHRTQRLTVRTPSGQSYSSVPEPIHDPMIP
ncbi:protein of unknown function DUF222 [Saccharomonospora marina XMU15]|uniref:DUF222 domain-containing protein n=1 Tax=Saccharomonospora marina XMU15 TaxID=882083 RepID=H5X3Z1_9PSEU|nr:HNH endonuclease signature motif containing protein [Saccharomonospora marina]EHR52209.1 protein of unknown function DUF222 [Saccharomonospora marina XMU15]